MIQQVVLFDKLKVHTNLFPITLTRSAADCLVGISTIRQKWERAMGMPVMIKTIDYLQALYPSHQQMENTLFVASNILPNKSLIESILQLGKGEGLTTEEETICFLWNNPTDEHIQFKQYTNPILQIHHPWDIFKTNGEAMEQDFAEMTAGRKSMPIHETNTVIGEKSKIFIEEGAVVRASIFNTEGGCIYIGREAEVMEGCVIRGPFALGEHAVTKLSTKVYGPTTVGAYSKIGGEVNNSVIFAFSNKGHDGFLGNSVLGEWCNLGADTNNSNLKNNYGEVKAYNYAEKKEIKTGLQFCGLIMGDHSKSGINTMFNTGTVCGVSSNIFGGGFPPKYIPSFSWGGAENMETFQFDKAMEVANRMMERRGKKVSPQEEKIMKVISEMS